ncbi:MAG: diacylglycerol kinase [Planctomycetaceae bacterium]|nr:diacylglycerol kinase [Planctomycetaceae bacterium]
MFRLLKRAPARFRKSFGYSWAGLKCTFQKEESFRLEIIALIVMLILFACISWPIWKKLILVASYLLIPLMEIVNTAIEDLCNLITREQNELVKNAKDKGAMAVLLAIIINAIVLACLLLY